MRTRTLVWALLTMLALVTLPAPAAAQAMVYPPAIAAGPVPYERIAEAVNRAMADFPGEYSIALEDLSTGQLWLHNADRLYHPASTLKLPVALYALEQYRAGNIGWQDLIEYTPADYETPGAGAFETAEFGELYPIEDLVNRSLIYSNNVAVNMLGRHFGWGNIELWTETIGGSLVHENRLPRASAVTVLHWWKHLHRLSQEDPDMADLIVGPLREVTYRGRITAGLPQGVPHLHKYGSYDGNYHDSGIVYTTRPYVLVVLTGGAPVEEADAAIARVSAEIYRVMAGPPSISPAVLRSIEALASYAGPAEL